MNQLLIIIFSLLSFVSVSAQDTSVTKDFVRSFERNFNPLNDALDYCCNFTSLLKISLNAHEVLISFSGNAPEWMKNKLTNSSKNFDPKNLKEYLSKNKDLQIIYPIIIINKSSPWTSYYPQYSSTHYAFQGKFLEGKMVFSKPMEIDIYGPYKKQTVGNIH